MPIAREYTLNQLNSVFNYIANGHSGITAFYAGQYENYQNPDKLYPLLWVNAQTVESRANENVYDYHLMVLDRCNEDELIRNEVYSDTLRTSLDIKAYLTNNNIYSFKVEQPISIEKVTDEINSDMVCGWRMSMKIRTDWKADICSIPGLIQSYTYSEGTVSTGGSNFLTCSNVTACTSLQNYILNAVSGNTPSSLNYIFSGDSNISVTTGGTNPQLVTHSLNPNVSITNLTIGSSLSGNSITANFPNATFNMNAGRILGLSNLITSALTVSNNISSGETNLNEVFAHTVHYHNDYSLTSHTHSFAEILNTAHTHSLSAILNTAHTHSFSEILNTAHTHSLAEILNTAHTHSNYVLTADTPYEVSYYRKRGSNLTRWYHSGVNAVANSTVSLAKDVIHYMPFIVPSTQTVILIACEVTTFGTASAVARLGIFDSITNTSSIYHMQPNNVVADCGTVAIDSNGVKSIGSLSITLTPGLYFLTINHNSTAATTFRSLGAAACPTLFAVSTSMGATNTNHLTENQTFGAFVASTNNAITAVSSLPPIVAVQIS